MYVSCPAIQYWVLTNISFFFIYYIDSHYVLSSIFLMIICFCLPLFIFNLLLSFQESNSFSDTIYYDFFLTLTFLRPFDNKCDGFFRSLNYKIIYRSQYILLGNNEFKKIILKIAKIKYCNIKMLSLRIRRLILL